MACFAMDEFETAKSAFETGYKLEPGSSQFKMWIRKCNAELALEEEQEETAAAPTNTVTPMDEDSNKKSKLSGSQSNGSSTNSIPPATSTPTPTPTSVVTPPPSVPKVRHEWLQTSSQVEITIFLKNVKQEQTKVDIQEQSLCVTVALSPANEYQLEFEKLFDKVIPDKTKVTYLSTKVEIKLQKANQTRWKSLEFTGATGPASTMDTPAPTVAAAAKPKAKNWDKIVSDVAGTEPLDNEDSLNKVFQDIFSNGSDEQKKAMVKSFTESGGTVLSTNWEDVGKKKVDGSPPDGMQMHKWQDL